MQPSMSMSVRKEIVFCNHRAERWPVERQNKLLCQSAVHDNFFDRLATYPLHVTNRTAATSPPNPAGLPTKFFPSSRSASMDPCENNQESTEVQWHSYVQ